ncbi:amino acid ABC transporter permease [Alsobacter sp. SYSU M60028]|uniref:Amino acid ABC transporter permease n=1 Tax=Alsobacter ponti TaxID=2962936 RepID=A0ABT1LEN4_9HYPH|nr:amino acid ABC transporter permease [Alsobacter ponti]MCP8939894.1 amino acid ABC transporter permease [Alsobacter ponti]
MSQASGAADTKPRVSPINDPRVRSLVFQAMLVLVIGFAVFTAINNARENLQRQKIASGFGFWDNIAGFAISQTLIPYSEAVSSYGQAFWVGLLNTLLVAAIGIVLATLLGFVMGVARLSKNILVSGVARWYVEIVRNLPLLLQLLFWYNAVLKALPAVRDSMGLPFGSYLNQRGLFMPQPIAQPGFNFVIAAFFAGLLGAGLYARWARIRQERTGQQSPVLWVRLALVVGLPVLVFLATGAPLQFDFPSAGRFNISGGMVVQPEFLALLFGLVIYTGAFITEVVRAGILAVSHGQTEASYALGLRPNLTTRLIIIPQALRVIIPPLTSQYLNLTKNSSLAVFVGYPDLANVFTGTVLNQTGQAIEVVGVTMLVYLSISLGTSTLMNWYNSRKALVER